MIRRTASQFMVLWRRLRAVEERPLSVALLALGLALTFFEYKNYQSGERTKTSYQHVQEWEDKGYKSALDRVSGVILNANATALDKVPADLLEDMSDADKDLARLNTAMNRLAGDEAVQEDLDQLIYFFDKLSVCVSRDLCDSGLIEDFFRENLLRFDVYSKAHVAQRRVEIDGYGELTEAFVEHLKTPHWSVWNYWPL